MTRNAIRLGTRARVTRAEGLDAEKMLELAKAKAPDPSVFDTYAPLFWKVRASSNRLDFYHTRMSERTLQNFVRGLKDGVSYQDSHNPRRNGWGQSLDGELVRTGETDPAINAPILEAWGDFFTLSGLSLGGQSTDDLGAAIRAGVWRDVSVGFYASDIECGLCGKQLNDFGRDGCPHIPGIEYELAKGKREVAWAWINDGELVEVSQVYDGASPGAGVAKAELLSAEGALDERARVAIERRYQVRLPMPQRSYSLGGMPVVGKGAIREETVIGLPGQHEREEREEVPAAGDRSRPTAAERRRRKLREMNQRAAARAAANAHKA